MMTTMRAILVKSHGGPEVLECVEVERPRPGPGQVRIRVETTGVNFLDVNRRMGEDAGPLPYIPGVEAIGRIDAIGPGAPGGEAVLGLHVLSTSSPGAYAEYVIAQWNRTVPAPERLDPQIALAGMLQGLSAHYLTHDTYPIRPGITALVHAAGGGTGSLVVQMAHARGARVLAVVSSENKVARARSSGADEVLVVPPSGLTEAVRACTGGIGVDVVYDSVGRTTMTASLGCLKRRGMLVLYGHSSGKVEPMDPLILKSGGSLYLTRPTLGDYISTHQELLERSIQVFDAIRASQLAPKVHTILPLEQAAKAHELLESRTTQGKILLTLIPSVIGETMDSQGGGR
jgi:NADPH2:quinone reductase